MMRFCGSQLGPNIVGHQRLLDVRAGTRVAVPDRGVPIVLRPVLDSEEDSFIMQNWPDVAPNLERTPPRNCRFQGNPYLCAKLNLSNCQGSGTFYMDDTNPQVNFGSEESLVDQSLSFGQTCSIYEH